MDGQEHEPEAWMERNVNGVLAGTHAAQQLAAEAGDHWRRVTELVVQLSEAVTAGVECGR